jgi:subtilase family serine protease
VVDNIDKPIWDGANHRSVIRATIKNIGNAAAGSTLARVIDPTTPQPTGAPYNSVAPIPALAPGASATVTFYLPYWVYNPDVTLEVTADYKNELSECNEENNVKVFEDVG